jgi:hypothetical protein
MVVQISAGCFTLTALSDLKAATFALMYAEEALMKALASLRIPATAAQTSASGSKKLRLVPSHYLPSGSKKLRLVPSHYLPSSPYMRKLRHLSHILVCLLPSKTS